MTMTRRRVTRLIGGFAGAVGVGGAHAQRWLLGQDNGSCTDESVDIDALIIGGGVQGLAILNELRSSGFSAALVTNSPLGTGQTLLSHGVLNSGYPFPNAGLRAALTEDCLPFARRSGLELQGQDRFFLISPSRHLSSLRRRWDAGGYAYAMATPDDLPRDVAQSQLFTGEDPSQVARIEEFTFPKQQLVRLLSDDHRDQIVRGNIESIACRPADGPTECTAMVDTVSVQTDSDKRVRFRPTAVFVAAGGGTRRLIDQFVKARGPCGSPEIFNAWRDGVVSHLDSVKYHKTHMLCIRGPRSALPDVNMFVLEHRLMIVSKSVDSANDNRSETGGDLITLYVTPFDPGATSKQSVPDLANGTVDFGRIETGVSDLFKVFPALRARAAQHNSPIEFAVYAGYKQSLGAGKFDPFCEPIAGLENVIVALPSLIPGAFRNARRSLAIMARCAGPAQSQPDIPQGGRGVTIGEVSENSGEVKWMRWAELSREFPSVDG